MKTLSVRRRSSNAIYFMQRLLTDVDTKVTAHLLSQLRIHLSRLRGYKKFFIAFLLLLIIICHVMYRNEKSIQSFSTHLTVTFILCKRLLTGVDTKVTAHLLSQLRIHLSKLRGYKKLFMFNSAEQEIHPAHKC